MDRRDLSARDRSSFLEISENDCQFLHDVVLDHLKAESKGKRPALLQEGGHGGRAKL